MSDLALQAEHLKLARLLGCPESTIAALTGLDVAAMRQLRAVCTATLFDGDKASLQKVAAAAKLMPNALNAIVSEKAMGPVLASRVAGLLPPKDAVEIAKRVPLAFNTEVTLQIDPRSAAPMLQLMPVELVVAVTREVVKRREYIVMARFVDTLTNEQIRASMEVLDDESLLRIGFFVESPKRLEEVIGLMSDAKLQKVVGVAAKPGLDLGGAVLVLLSGVSDALRARMVQAAMQHPDAKVGEHLVASARQHGMLGMLSALPAKMATGPGARLSALVGVSS